MSMYCAKCLTCGCQSAGTDPQSAQAVADCHAEACPGHVVAVMCDPVHQMPMSELTGEVAR